MIEVQPLARCDAVLTIPGSKSYSHRACIIAGLAEGESIIENFLRCEDTAHTLEGLKEMGIRLSDRGDALFIQGCGGRLSGGTKEIFIGHSGTSMRFLTALAALRRGTTLLDGSERMRKRPLAGLLEGLEGLGARAYSREVKGHPPVVVESRGLTGGTVRIEGKESSQFLSAILMIAPYARSDVRIEVIGPLASRPYVEITKNVMAQFGVEVWEEGGSVFGVRAGQRYVGRRYSIEGDASNASYFFAAAAITGGRVRVENVSPLSLQGDWGFLEILQAMGCEVTRGDHYAEVRGGSLRGLEIDMNRMPDLVPTLAVTAIFARGKTVMRNIGHLRGKESDRIGDLAEEIRKMGISVETGPDWLSIQGGKAHGTEIDPHGDHRLAMALAIAGLKIRGIRIANEACVAKSFPGFWETLGKLY